MAKKEIVKKESNKLSLFEGEEIRRVFFDNDWYYSVEDVVQVLTDSKDVKQYVKKLKSRDEELNTNWGTICTLLPLIAKDGKRRNINCSNTEGIFRIIQSISSKKAEPFKLWLARVGKERIDEIEQPEKAIHIAGNITKEAIEKLEEKTGKKVVTHKNAKDLDSLEIKKELIQQSLPKEDIEAKPISKLSKKSKK